MHKDENGASYLEVDNNFFSNEAILAAIYKFANRYQIIPKKCDEKMTKIMFYANENDISPEFIQIFYQELIDQQLRKELDAKFDHIRTIIVEKAFSES
jgi:His-Xaa-Ser system protein HxsD